MTQKRTTENNLVMSGNTAAARRKVSRTRSKHSATPAETPEVSAPAVPEIAEPAPILSETLSVTAVVPSLPAPVSSDEPAREEIARLAYSYWEARGFQGGSAEEDWLRAEIEIRAVSAVTA